MLVPPHTCFKNVSILLIPELSWKTKTEPDSSFENKKIFEFDSTLNALFQYHNQEELEIKLVYVSVEKSWNILWAWFEQYVFKMSKLC